MWQKLRILSFQNKLISPYSWIRLYYFFLLCHKNIWHEYFSLVIRLYCLKANCLSELVASEISQDKDSSAGSWENKIFGLVQGLLKMVKSPAPAEFGDATDARTRDNCHSIGMTVEHIIYADPADFSTNFCRHSCRLPRSFSKPSASLGNVPIPLIFSSVLV